MELLISMVILAIIGWVAVSALQLAFGAFTQTDDQIAARSEIEFALNELRPQFTNIGLGMPNNRADKDSFKNGFAGLVSGSTSFDVFSNGESMTAPVQQISGDSALLYAWAEPVEDVLIRSRHTISGDITPDELSFDVSDFSTLSGKLTVTNDKSNPNSWVLFPSLRIPLHAIQGGGPNKLKVEAPNGPVGSLQTFSEVHLLKIARLYIEGDGKLTREIFGGETKVIAHNIKHVSFDFAPTGNTRLLTMSITARGNVPDSKHPITETIIWRIRN